MQQAFGNILRSFYSRDFYRNLALQQQGIGWSYILLLTLIATLLLSASMFINYQGLSRVIHQLPEVVNDFPAITFKDNKLTVDKPTPYYVNMLPAPEKIRVVIDPNYQITDIDALNKFMKNNGILAVVTNDKIAMLKERRNELDITDFKDERPFSITHDNWRKLGEIITKYGMPALIGFVLLSIFIGSYIANFFFAFIIGIVVKIVSVLFGARLDFAGSMRHASALHIPVYIITMLPMLIGFNTLSGKPAYGIWGLYLVFAVWSARARRD